MPYNYKLHISYGCFTDRQVEKVHSIKEIQNSYFIVRNFRGDKLSHGTNFRKYFSINLLEYPFAINLVRINFREFAFLNILQEKFSGFLKYE